MTTIDTADLERLALSLPAGDWVKLTGMAEATVVPSTQYDAFMSGSLIQGDLRIVHDGDPRDPMCVAIAEAIALLPALICEVLAHRKAEAWQPISSAPFHTPVIVKVGQMTFPAVLRGNAAMDENGQDCAQWQAMNEGEHPPCWSDGACWASNADGLASMQPTGWKPATTEAEGGCDA